MTAASRPAVFSECTRIKKKNDEISEAFMKSGLSVDKKLTAGYNRRRFRNTEGEVFLMQRSRRSDRMMREMRMAMAMCMMTHAHFSAARGCRS